MPILGDDEPGGYAMQPVDGGILRLDPETGRSALCTRPGTGLAREPNRGNRS